MIAINLDKNFKPLKDTMPEIDFQSFKFSGGENHIKIGRYKYADEITGVVITHRIKSMDDLMLVIMAKDAVLRHPDYDIQTISLFIPYIPYARQDRVCDVGESFSLKIFCDILNSAKFDKVLVLDPHSKVSIDFINNCYEVPYSEYVIKAAGQITSSLLHNPFHSKSLSLVSPDAGAYDKAEILMKKTLFFDKMVSCTKHRDPATGAITKTIAHCGYLNNRSCFVVDDICDGGRTFLELAKVLKAKGAGALYLYVTHGIFSKGFEELLKYYTHIFTTNSFNDIVDNNVTQFKITL